MPSQTKILVVDDESATLVLCQHLLELDSFQVLTTVDPEEALQILQSQKIDLLLTDIRLPVMDGFELLSHAREYQPEIAVVVMTGYRTVETAIKALRSGVDGLVIKPYELGSELLDIVKHALKSKQEKTGKVPLQLLQPVFKLGSTSVLEATPAGVEKSIAEAMRKLLAAQHFGMYVRPGRNNHYQLIVAGGNLPGEEDDFWQAEAVAHAVQAEGFARDLILLGDDAGVNELLERQGWNSFLMVALKRRRDHYLFLAARDKQAPSFRQIDLDLLALLARQSCVTLENVRTFANLAALAQRVERPGGILQQAERMSILEKVVPSLGHDLNNPVQAIKNSLYLAGRPENRGERAGHYLTLAQKELYRLEGTLQHILALSDPLCDDVVTLDLESITRPVLEMLAARLREQNVQVRANYTRPLPSFKGARDQMELVFFILLMNALDAMDGIPGEKILWIDAQCQNDQLSIAIEDSGPGVPHGLRDNLFKPFTTTKQDGTGIGLTVSRRILEMHSGKLAFEAPIHGTGGRIVALLPCKEKHS